MSPSNDRWPHAATLAATTLGRGSQRRKTRSTSLHLVGRVVGPYHVVARLGAGGMGEVFLGHDPRLQRRVALKCIDAGVGTPELRARALREARAVARLNHPNIAAVYDVLEEGERTYIVMEYVEGESLAARIGRGPLAPDEVRSIGRQLASALSAAHGQGIVHRDLKPANIHFTSGGSIKVLDFGVAKMSVLSPPDESTGHGPAEATLSGNPGTPIYMSPEQLFSRDVDGRSDIYSAGVVLFQAATGVRPFEERDSVSLAFAMTSRPARTVQSLNPDVPRPLSDAIGRALRVDPAERFQSASELESALAPTAETVSLPGPADAPAALRGANRSRLTAAVVVIVVIAMSVAAHRPLLSMVGLQPSRPAASAVLAVLPVESPTGDPSAEYFGAGLTSIVAENFNATPGVRVLSRTQTAPYAKKRNDLDAMRRELGAGYVLDLRVNSPPPQVELEATLRRAGHATALWAHTLSGDVLSIERRLLDEIARALERAGVWRQLTEADWTRIRRVPTTSADAMEAYSEARALIDRHGTPANAERAVALLEQAVRLDAAFGLAHAALGDAYLEIYRTGRNPLFASKANESVMQAARLNPGAATTHYSLGNVQWATGRYQEAVASLRRSIELQPDNDDTHRLLGRVLADRGDIDAATGELLEAIRIRPHWTNQMALGAVSYAGGRYHAALEAYRHAAELQPNDPGPFTGLGLIYYVLGDLPQAIGNYEHAVRLGPSAAAYSNLGLAYYSARRYRDAAAAWKQAISITPRYVLYHRNLGDAYQRLRDNAAAAAEYREAVRLGEELLKVNARDIEMITLVAICEAKLGRVREAERHAAEALALAPTSRVALQRSAEVHAIAGNADAALKDLAAAIDRGYARSVARANDEFETLRKLPAFQAMVAPDKER